MKLTTNKALQAFHTLDNINGRIAILANEERFAPVTVHSHGQMIDDILSQIDSAKELMLQFKTIVQGR